MRSWGEQHRPKLRIILEKIREWNADYIVPVGSKSAKMFRTLGNMEAALFPRVFYRDYFRFKEVPLYGKRIAVVDDVARTCSTLSEYRDFFEQKGGKVRTFAVAGHVDLKDTPSSCYDPLAEIESYVSEPGYQDFLLGEAESLLQEGFYQDVRHLTLEMLIPSLPSGCKASLRNALETRGYTYAVPPTDSYPRKWSVMDPDFCSGSPLLQTASGIVKIRFHEDQGSMTCVPMVLPDIRVATDCKMSNMRTPFELPCQSIRNREHAMDELCYWSVSLLLSAELGRLFVSFLASYYGDDFYKGTGNLAVRPIDFYRYFGIEEGIRLQRGIESFLLQKDYEADSSLQEYLSSVLVPRREYPLRGTFSVQALSKLMDHLREGYRNSCNKAGTRKGVHYAISMEKMEEVSGASRLLLTEFLDCLCDLGTLVPVTTVTPQFMVRTWRSGESDEILSWKRTHVLIPLMINVIAEELGFREHKVNSLLLMKAAANFVYDYPGKAPFFERMHCLTREPGVHGTVVKAYHPIRAPSPVPLYRYERLGNRYTVERQAISKTDKGYPKKRSRQVLFASQHGALNDLSRFYDNSQSIPLDEITNYIALLARLAQMTGSTDVLTALSICRTPESFYWHIHKNLTLWIEKFGVFLDHFQFPYDEHTRKGPLHRSGEAAFAGLKKVTLWKQLDQYLKTIEDVSQIRFILPRSKILGNLSKERKLPILNDVLKILTIQRALTGIALLKLFPTKEKRSPREVQNWVVEQFKKCDFSFDTKLILEANDRNSIERVLRPAYLEVCYHVESLPPPKPESERGRNKEEYMRSAHNRAVTLCQKVGWSGAAFVHWDLTGSRRAGEDAVIRTATLYEYSDVATERFGGKCMTLHPNGEDRMLYIFGNPVAPLRAAAMSMNDFAEAHIDVKGGISYSRVELGKEHSTLIPMMGLAKDLCELKDSRSGYRNRKDMLVCEEFVDSVASEGVSRDYFAPLDIAIEFRVGEETRRLPIFKFRWEKFFKDNR